MSVHEVTVSDPMDCANLFEPSFAAINGSFSELRKQVELLTSDITASDTRQVFDEINSWQIKIKRKVARTLSCGKSLGKCASCWQNSMVGQESCERKSELVAEVKDEVDSLFLSTSQGTLYFQFHLQLYSFFLLSELEETFLDDSFTEVFIDCDDLTANISQGLIMKF